MKKPRQAPAPLIADNEMDTIIKQCTPCYASTFKEMGNDEAAKVCKKGPLALGEDIKTRKRAAKALYAFADQLNDKDDEYYLNRLADRVLGYSDDDEANG